MCILLRVPEFTVTVIGDEFDRAVAAELEAALREYAALRGQHCRPWWELRITTTPTEVVCNTIRTRRAVHKFPLPVKEL